MTSDKRLLILLITLGFCFNVVGQEYIVKDIQLKGNERTRDKIVLRELSFSIGDTISHERLEYHLNRSKYNLDNTLLFNFVSISYEINERVLIFSIQMDERWYIWPFPILILDDTNFSTWLKSKDFSRFDYGVYFQHDNFRGNRESLRLSAQTGYTQELGLVYSIPFINRKQTTGLISEIKYETNKQIAYTTDQNLRQFYRSENGDAIQNLNVGIGLEKRNHLYVKNLFAINYHWFTINDSLLRLNQDYLFRNAETLTFLSAYYRFVFDKRNYKIYPTRGVYVKAELIQNGLSVMNSALSVQKANLTLKQYSPLWKKLNLFTSLKLGWSSNKNESYLLSNVIGYSDMVRGYEFYVFNCQNMVIAKVQLNRPLFENKILKFGFIPIKQFNKVPVSAYFNAFADYGYGSSFMALNNSLQEQHLIGYGLSLDLVTYYNKLMRLEFAFNKFGESGIFLHFTTPI